MNRIITLLLSALLVHAVGAKEAAPEVSLRNPTLTSGKIAPGTPLETEWFTVDSGVSGPTVLVIGGMHGNEPAGSIAAEQIRHWPIVRGKMVVVPRANVLALEANTRLTPGQPEADGNLNRNFPRADGGPNINPRGELAKAFWKFSVQTQPDWVIDLHEGYAFNRSHKPPKGKKKSVGSSVIYRGSKEMDALAKQMVAAADATVTDPDKRFSLLRRGPVATGLAQACINALGAEGMILETTYNDQPMSLRTRQHRAMANVLLQHIGMIDRDCRNRLAASRLSDVLQVAVFDGTGAGRSRSKLAGVIAAAPDMAHYAVGAYEMKPPVLQQFDVVVFPGGSGSKQAAAIGAKGRAAVQAFVHNGGGYLGVCAGAYLCSAQYSWSLNLIDSQVFTGSAEIPGKGKKNLWYRGKESGIDMELSALGRKLYGEKGIPNTFEVRYANGPIISPRESDALEDYQVFAWFRSETGLWEPQEGTMINTPAIVSGTFGKGRVMSVSPHPERTPALHPIITQSIRWAGAAE